MGKIDLHTHSVASPDGGLRLDDYRTMLESGGLDTVAITDHDTITFAVDAHKKLGDRIVIGEEITTVEGEIIGLFLKQRVPPQLSAEETIRHIRRQGGLVYIPHPFEKVRRGLRLCVLERIAVDTDIIEIHNGRAYFEDKSTAACRFTKKHGLAGAASSDAHGRMGWGRTYSMIEQLPTRDNLVKLLGTADYSSKKVGFNGVFYPKLNRLRKRLTHAA